MTRPRHQYAQDEQDGVHKSLDLNQALSQFLVAHFFAFPFLRLGASSAST
jgi:hypothetical protein